MENKEPIYIGVYPFEEGIELDKCQGHKVLEEAAELYTAYIDFCKCSAYEKEFKENQEVSDEEYENIVNALADRLLAEAADVIQSAVNLIYVTSGKDFEATQKAFISAFNYINNKNTMRGYFGEIEEEKSEEENDGESA